jgi:site-specific DNA-methyltransferase (adenine-specific)
MRNAPLPRIDGNDALRGELLQYCRLEPGGIWEDDQSGHRVACIDATDSSAIHQLMDDQQAALAIHDPPYNLVAFAERDVREYIGWCRKWVRMTSDNLSADAAFYVWLGADQNDGFQPLPDFILMMREMDELRPRSFITMRNQRGYGTQHNWMAARQELLYYAKGDPAFQVQYTDIPKVLRGYYKTVNGKLTENFERSKSNTIRPGNVWIDIQQVFYRMEENISGCFAQKPLKAIDRIVQASSQPNDLVIDWFAHSGTTLLSCERAGRCCYTADIDPVYCEITIRRLQHYRSHGKLGWQNDSPFPEHQLHETKSIETSNAGKQEVLLF